MSVRNAREPQPEAIVLGTPETARRQFSAGSEIGCVHRRKTIDDAGEADCIVGPPQSLR